MEKSKTAFIIEGILCLNELGDIPNGTSISVIFMSVDFLVLKYSRKKVSTTAQESFSAEHMAYTKMLIDYLHTQNPYKLKFFDEGGI